MQQIVQRRAWNDAGTTDAGASATSTPTASVSSDSKGTNVNINVPSFNSNSAGYFSGALGLAGLGLGVWFAFKHDAKWYGYVGYALLFGFLGGIAGQVTDRTIKAIKG